MNRPILQNCSSAAVVVRALGAAFLVAGLLAPMLGAAPLASAGQPGGAVLVADAEPGTQPATVSLQGSCVFNGTKSTWSATLTRKGDNLYDAVYTSSWGGKPLAYKGTIKTDLKTTITGDGVSTNKNGNGKFEFTGKFGDDGAAKCTYKEIGGGRGGSMTVDAPK